MFEQVFKNIDDLLYKDTGADSELDYIGQTLWIIFLRYFDALEVKKAFVKILILKPWTKGQHCQA